MSLKRFFSNLKSRLFRPLYRTDELKQELAAKTKEAEESGKIINILKNILNGMDEMICVTIPETGEVLFANDNLKKHYNIEGDCIGQTCYKIFQADKDATCDFCPLFQLETSPDENITWIENSSLTKRAYRNMARFIEWPNGERALLQYSADITELNAAKEQAIQANNAKNKFLARVSHETLTPLSAILGIAEVKLQKQALPADMQDTLSKIYDSGYMLLGIIHEVLDLAKLEAGKLDLLQVKYDIAGLIDDVHLNIMRFENKPITFTLFVDPNIPKTLFGDKLRIKHILNNLLSNAFKFTHSGDVSLSVAAEQGNVEDNNNVVLVFRISDTGQGMSEEQVDTLFDDYAHFNMEPSRTTEGIGLGMIITNKLVRMMNGTINVQSEPGKGSVFTVWLPQRTTGSTVLGKELAESLKQFPMGKAAQIQKARQIVREYMPYGKVLVVDDAQTNLYVARGHLAPYGLSVQTATSGFEAIENIKKGAVYDIIFMDHFMPKMDGIETVKIIRSLGYKRPIIALSANTAAGQTEIFLSNGFDGFLTKPIDLSQLNILLNKLIRDVYPGEAATKVPQPANDKKISPVDSTQLIKEIFIRDAEKAALVLGEINQSGYQKNEDIQSYIITVHAMKSALANIGEMQLSALAHKLEEAGKEKNINILAGETPVFLANLRKLTAKIKPDGIDEGSSSLSQEDKDYLSGKLSIVQKACAEYDKKTAKDTLGELKLKLWPPAIKKLLDTLAEYLLHSDFEEAANMAENYIKNRE